MPTHESPVAPPPDDAEEVAQPRREITHTEATDAARRRGWWRPVVASLLILVAAILAPLSVLSTWANGQIRDTDRYLATVAPLANDPDVQAAVSARVEQVIFSYLDLEAISEELVTALDARGLPPSASTTLQALAGPIQTGARDFVSDRIDELVRSDAFEQAWVEANRTAHKEMVGALTGDTSGGVTVERGTVSINLAIIINAVKGQLSAAGFGIADQIPEVGATFTVMESPDLANVQTLIGVIDGLSTWLPVAGLGLLVIAVVIARDRRRMVLAAGLTVAAAMLLLGVTLNVIRPIYLDALPPSSSAAAAGAVYDQLVSFIRLALRGLLVVALTIAVAAWLSARTGSGASARSALTGALGAAQRGTARAGLRTGRLGQFLATYKSPIRLGVGGTAAVAYLAQDHPTGSTAVVLVLLTAVALGLLALLAAEPVRTDARADTA